MNPERQKVKAAIFGGSGYGGAELLRILLFHPTVDIVLVTANEHAGKRVSDVHRNLRGLTDLEFGPEIKDLSTLADLDVIFLALPHGMAMKIVPQLPAGVKVIDLSGDFRLADPGSFEEFYGFAHDAMDLQGGFEYGLTEVARERISAAERIANPGCFATATLLALYPLAQAGLLENGAVVDAKTGSSGSGAKPAPNTHHPERAGSFYAYKPFSHQHLPEIEQSLAGADLAPGGLTFMTHSLPVARGIFASCYVELPKAVDQAEIRGLFEDFYSDSFFIRLLDGSPNINWVKMTNFCDISVNVKGRRLAVFSAIDNLVKGAAGQAVQNMNLMFGLPEEEGLKLPGGNP